MSLGGRFQYKYTKNSPKQMSVKCSIDDCPWKITTHVVAGNEILCENEGFLLVMCYLD